MGSNAVDLGLRDGSHANLVESSREEGSKGGDEHDVPVPATESDPHPAHVLLSNEALHEAVGKRILVGEGKGRVLRVSVQSNDAVKVLPQFHERFTIHLASGMLQQKQERHTSLCFLYPHPNSLSSSPYPPWCSLEGCSTSLWAASLSEHHPR